MDFDTWHNERMQKILDAADSTAGEVDVAIEELEKRKILRERCDYEYLNSLGLQKGGFRGRRKSLQASWLAGRIDHYARSVDPGGAVDTLQDMKVHARNWHALALAEGMSAGKVLLRGYGVAMKELLKEYLVGKGLTIASK